MPSAGLIGFAGLLEAGGVRQASPKFKTFLGQITTSGQQLLQVLAGLALPRRAHAGWKLLASLCH